MKALSDTLAFESAYKVFPTEGNLVYEYNPFFNYRINETMIYYKNRLWLLTEFAQEFITDTYYYNTDDESIELLTYEDAITKIIESDDYKDYSDSYTCNVNDDGYITISYSATAIDGESETTTEDKTDITSYKLISAEDIMLGIVDETITIDRWSGSIFNIPSTETAPVVYLSGLLVDFETEELSFSLNNPVNILPLWSYDNSVNLIINDGLNPPRIINSRFSPTERHQYLVCDRKGDNDTNIYDRGEQFDIDTSLYKKVTTIPKLKFNQVSYGGNLAIGNYHFYFKYVDEDGNESDFFAESGLVSIFIGLSADSIYSGFESENSHKLVKFILSNTDAGYSKIRIYYTRASSQVNQVLSVEAIRIDTLYYIQELNYTVITITGYEPTTNIDKSEINLQYLIYGSAETQELCLNMLFLANVDKPNIPYEDLADCALRFLPFLQTKSYPVDQIGTDYSGSVSGTYYSPEYIYNNVGYWDDEIYRIGVVFILNDNTLSPVFNVRGISGITTETTLNSYTFCDFFTSDGNRNYVSYDPQYYTIIGNDNNSSAETLENAKGVILIDEPGFDSVIGFNFYVPTEVIEYLTDTLGVLGMFFVRQKRIATTLALAYTIGIDNQSYTPMLPVSEDEYQTESFLSEDTRYLEQTFTTRLRSLEAYLVSTTGALCPEYDVNSAYLNNLFNGGELVCRNCSTTQYLKRDSRQYYPESFSFDKDSQYTTVKIIGVEDNVKLVGIGDNYFRSRAGEAEEAFRFELIGFDNKETEMENVIRGSYGPYIGITGYDYSGHLIDIKIPNYNPSYMDDYFSIRYNDKSGFYAISNRIDFTNLSDFFEDSETYSSEDNSGWDGVEYRILSNTVYRGDCYICLFTHRVNRNFQDPSAPTNDDIVDPECWADNFEVDDGVIDVESFDEINLGDVNAVMLGMWVTLVVRSTFNLNVRSIDISNADEIALTGHSRGFYPVTPMTGAGSYKIPEALCINQGFQKSLSERINLELPDMPWIKNEFSNRIVYSNIQVLDAFLNGWRTFMGLNYRDYPKTYGSITKLIEWAGNLVCVFEHGIGLISVNERALAGEGSGGNVFINTSNVLPENPIILSDTFGSLWRDSVIKTPNGVYGVDTIGKKIWKVVPNSSFTTISDKYVLEFLHNNISLTEREMTPIIGVRNVKTHYNKYKHDVMFTFYDNLYGFEECVWNLCYNEDLNEWITFYSWVPSYSENIYNQFFSFDRNTSKWIAKLGVSKAGNDFSDGVTLEDNIIYDSSYSSFLSLSNRTLPSGDNTTVTITYTLERDNYGNYKKFEIEDGYLKLKDGVKYADLCSEFYYRTNGNDTEVLPTSSNYTINTTLTISTDDNGRRRWLDLELLKNSSTVVILLNIRANISVSYSGTNATLEESYASGSANLITVDAGYYESVVAVIPYYNMLFLTTDFWKHGRAGIIDIADKIYPCYWYGKQHPFEFEFIVNNLPSIHKIFDNLEILSNNAEPESFHYEIIGDCYEFAKDKKNMYIRQEATKELYQYNGTDVTYDTNYSDLESEQRDSGMVDSDGNTIYDKSTLLPLYYSRQDTINEIEDYYHLKDDVSTKNFSLLAGGEIVHYETLDEYRIWNHAKAVDINEEGRMRGNMQYIEDMWRVQINPINIVQKNEEKWTDLDGNETDKVPAELGQSPIPDDVKSSTELDVPDTDGWENRGYVQWGWEDSNMREVKLKDKWIKIRIRYSGEKLAVISGITTLYSLSFS